MSEMDGWQIKRLDQIGDVYSGATPSTAKADYWDGDIVWVTPNDLSKLQTPFLSESAKKITKRGLKNCSTHLLPARSVTISSRAPIGYVAVPVVDFCTNQGCKSIKLYPEYHSEFVYYNILFNVEKLKNLGEGTTFAEISKTTLSAVEMPFLDNFEEQKQIAAILSTLDRAIEQTEAIIAKQQRIKAGLMQDLLTKGIDKHGVIRSETTHQFKDSPLGRIPVEWKVKCFSYGVVSSAFGPRFPATAYSEQGNIALLRTTDLDIEGNISYSTMPLALLDESTFESHILQKSDFLLTRSGTCGVPSVFEGFHLPVIPGAFLIRFRLDSGIVAPEYLRAYFNWEIGHKRLVGMAEGGVQKNIRGSSVLRMLFAFPGLKEQKNVVEVFSSQQSNLTKDLDRLAKLHKLKAGLMHDLLTGTVRVKTTPLPDPLPLRGEGGMS